MEDRRVRFLNDGVRAEQGCTRTPEGPHPAVLSGLRGRRRAFFLSLVLAKVSFPDLARLISEIGVPKICQTNFFRFCLGAPIPNFPPLKIFRHTTFSDGELA